MTFAGAVWRNAPPPVVLCVLVLSAGCAVFPWNTPGAGAAPPIGSGHTTGPASTTAFDPVGRYDLTMSSETMVSEGWMEIRGEPATYTGLIDIGGVAARILSLEVGEDHMTVRATTSQRPLILRLARDENFLSGNWILGRQRGTIVARKRPDHPSGGPVSIGRSFRPPHSDHDPS